MILNFFRIIFATILLMFAKLVATVLFGYLMRKLKKQAAQHQAQMQESHSPGEREMAECSKCGQYFDVKAGGTCPDGTMHQV